MRPCRWACVAPTQDWAVDYYSACLKLWTYLPLSNKAIGALGRMLTRVASGGGGGIGGGAAAARPAMVASSKSSSRSRSRSTAAAAIGGSALRAASGSNPVASASSVSSPPPVPSVKGPIAGRRAGLAGGGSASAAASAASIAGSSTGSRTAPIAGRRAAGGAGSSSVKSSSAPTVPATAAATTPAPPPPPTPPPAGAAPADNNDGDDASAGGGGPGGGQELQELWLRLGNAGTPIRWRQPCADSDKGIFTAEEVAKAAKPESFRAWKKKKDPNWRSIHEMDFPKHLVKLIKLDWQEKEEFDKWRDGVLTELAVQRAANAKDASARAAAERAERAERAELWRGLAAYGALRVLCLHRSVLCADDVTQLQGVLRASRGLRELQVGAACSVKPGVRRVGPHMLGISWLSHLPYLLNHGSQSTRK